MVGTGHWGSLAQQLLCCLLVLFAAPATAEDVSQFNVDWQFSRAAGEGVNPEHGAEWETVNLPHTPVIEPRIVNDQWQGIAFYRKDFEAPATWRNQVILLRFEAAMQVAHVRINGTQIGEHLGGYLPFTVDLTQHLRIGAVNRIEVRVDNRDNPLTGPKPLSQLDFNSYGGLYRGVTLMVRPLVHLSDEMLADRPAGGGLFVTYPMVSRETASIRLQADVQNSSPVSVDALVRHLLYRGDAMVASIEERLLVPAGGFGRSTQTLDLHRPDLWSPQQPDLYTLETRISDGVGNTDVTRRRIGIRSIAFTGQGQLLVNGQVTYLRGVNRHQEYPYVGYATSPQADYRDALLIKRAGFDYVRLSHYPHSTAFMEAADELGLLLLDAIPGWQFYNPDPRFSDQVVRTCRDMIRRDRNHPSVLAWECSLNETDMPPQLISRLVATVREEFPFDRSFAAGWISDGYDIFLQARQHRLQHYDTPSKPYVVSEYGDWEYYAQNAGLAQDRWGDLREEERSSRQALGSGEQRLLQQAFNIQEAHNDNLRTPAFADSYWVMFDYNRGYADDLELSGIMSIERVAKPSYDFFRSQRAPSLGSSLNGGGPMVSIASYWTADSSPRITIFANVEQVELVVNGMSLGRKRPTINRFSDRLAFPPFHFDAGEFMPGELRAIGYVGGLPVAEDRVRTPGAPAAICHYLDDLDVEPVTGDVVFLRASIIDQDGNPVRTNGTGVTFRVDGTAHIVGPADATTEAGEASALVRFGDVARRMPSFDATSSGLENRGRCWP